jgi:hypothetical protein
MEAAMAILRTLLTTRVRDAPRKRKQDTRTALKMWRALDPNSTVSTILTAMTDQTEPDVLDNLLWTAMVYACGDDASLILKQLTMAIATSGVYYLIPNAQLWLVQHMPRERVKV